MTDRRRIAATVVAALAMCAALATASAAQTTARCTNHVEARLRGGSYCPTAGDVR